MNLYFLFILFRFFITLSKISSISPSKSDYDFIPFVLSFKYPEYSSNLLPSFKTFNTIVSKFESISIIISKLFYTKITLKLNSVTEKVINKFGLNPLLFQSMITDNKSKKKNYSNDIINHITIIINFKNFYSQNKILETVLYNEKNKSQNKLQKSYSSLALFNINSEIKLDTIEQEEAFYQKAFKEIFFIMGFRIPYFKSKTFRNNFDVVPSYLVKHYLSYKTFTKWMNIANRKFNEEKYAENGDNFYYSSWGRNYQFNDIMFDYNKDEFKQEKTITEMSTNTLSDLGIYAISHCEVHKYQAGFGKNFSCLKANQQCIDKNDN